MIPPASMGRIELVSSSRKPFNIDSKMVLIDCSDNSGIQTILKCLNNLGVTGFLPPIGGAHAVMKLTS
jgi:hypothetical protein